MYIHFTFGTLGKENRLTEQTEGVISDILIKRRLLIGKNKEFLPTFNDPSAKILSFEDAIISKEDIHWSVPVNPDDAYIRNLSQAPPISYLPHDVAMICFIKIPFNKLKNSPHSQQYGKFGLGFEDNFLKQKGIKPVRYYTEKSVSIDPAIKEWNKNKGKSLLPEEKREIEKEILHFRKPATLFPSFKNSPIAKVEKSSGRFDMTLWTYDRYAEGYNFRDEQEHRIVFKNDENYMYFEEKNIFRIIVPNEESKATIEHFLMKEWTVRPEVTVYPQS